MEPQWNPSVESQAIGRVLRLGQEKRVKVIRYIMTNTVEQVSLNQAYLTACGWLLLKYIQSRQSKKLQLAEISWGSSSNEEESKLINLLVRQT